MENRICVITGANSGIGKVTAEALARKGFDIVMLCRNMETGQAVRQAIGAQNPSIRVELVACDLSRLASVREAARQVQALTDRIDVLVNNAGLIIDREQYSPDGYELTFATNHLGPFLLTNLLLDQLRRGQDARVITLASEAHRLSGNFRLDELANPPTYNSWRAYGRSKLCNILFSHELAERLLDDGITANSVHPGAVRTNFGSEGSGLAGLLFKVAAPFFRTAEEGADTSIWLASAPEVEHITGLYFADRTPKIPNKDARNNYYAKKLWELSERLTGLV